MTEEMLLKASAALLCNETSGSTSKDNIRHFPKVFVVGRHIYFAYKAALRCMLDMQVCGIKNAKVEEVTYEQAYREINHREPSLRHLSEHVDSKINQVGEGLVFGYDITNLSQREKLYKKYNVRQ